eukprot:TRINITY_DN40242_c0_g1_i1.p1 TRINITY_DN40242_c0_g1~~TRINITY_DN40242_c0_g1_i1.p1  ORF type:complete len:372 (+),score=124.32 TRINITY_DN40242_c0_g1_i1:475-1590(+)
MPMMNPYMNMMNPMMSPVMGGMLYPGMQPMMPQVMVLDDKASKAGKVEAEVSKAYEATVEMGCSKEVAKAFEKAIKCTMDGGASAKHADAMIEAMSAAMKGDMIEEDKPVACKKALLEAKATVAYTEALEAGLSEEEAVLAKNMSKDALVSGLSLDEANSVASTAVKKLKGGADAADVKAAAEAMVTGMGGTVVPAPPSPAERDAQFIYEKAMESGATVEEAKVMKAKFQAERKAGKTLQVAEQNAQAEAFYEIALQKGMTETEARFTKQMVVKTLEDGGSMETAIRTAKNAIRAAKKVVTPEETQTAPSKNASHGDTGGATVGFHATGAKTTFEVPGNSSQAVEVVKNLAGYIPFVPWGLIDKAAGNKKD